jgi:hypothetical protein
MFTNKRSKLFITIFLILALIPAGSISAQSQDPPTDPGSGTGQDETKRDSIRWVLPHGEIFMIDDAEYNIVLDYEQFITSETEVGQGAVAFIGLGETTITGDDGTVSSSPICGKGNGIGKCLGNVNKEEGSSLPNSYCGDVTVTPGIISLSTKKNTPAFPVVVGQDPNDEGVTIEYTIALQPTVVTYEKWQMIGHRFITCSENTETDDPNNYGLEYTCPNGWHPIIEHFWGCSIKEKYYKEDFNNLDAGISLTSGSRNWILGELAHAFPNARLMNPNWSYGVNSGCVWQGEVCVMNFALNFQVTDPGYYDIVIQGTTTGSKASPPRSFEINSGQVGVFLVDATGIAN